MGTKTMSIKLSTARWHIAFSLYSTYWGLMWEKASRSNMKIKAFHIGYEMINWITPRAWCNDYWKSAIYGSTVWRYGNLILIYLSQAFNISHTFMANKLVDHSDVVGASLVGAAPTTSSYLTLHLASMYWAKTTVRRDGTHFSFGICCAST